MNNNSLFRLQVRIQQAWTELRDSERGQTMVEYAGIGLVVAALVVAVSDVMVDGGIGAAIRAIFCSIIGNFVGHK